jgi:hypothetical protein
LNTDVTNALESTPGHLIFSAKMGL